MRCVRSQDRSPPRPCVYHNNNCDIQPWVCVVHPTVVPRTTQPSTSHRTVKWVLVNARGKVGRITSARWQVTLCDPTRQVSSWVLSALEVCIDDDALYKLTYTLLYFQSTRKAWLPISVTWWRLHPRGLEVKCGITNLQRKRGSNGVWIIQRN